MLFFVTAHGSDLKNQLLRRGGVHLLGLFNNLDCWLCKSKGACQKTDAHNQLKLIYCLVTVVFRLVGTIDIHPDI